MTLITGAEMKKSEKLLKGNNVAPPYEDTAPPDVSDQDTEDRALGRPQPGVEIPDGGYGWICVAAGLTINSFTWGPISAYGVYLAFYLNNSIFPGGRPLDYALVGGLNFGVSMLAAPVATVLVGKLGIHVPMLIGTTLLGGGFIAASFATEIWHLFLTQGVLVGLGVGLIWIPSTAILPQWFLKRRSLANGITSAGSGLGGILFSLVTRPMILNIGLAWALRTTGILTFAMNFIASILARDRNAIIQPIHHGLDIRLLRRLPIFLLLTWSFIVMLGYITLLYSLSEFALSLGLSESQADEITAFLNVGTAVGRPLTGQVSDRYGRIEVASIVTFVCGLTVFCIWIPSSSYGVTVFFALISGTILGVFWPTVTPLAAEVAELKEVPDVLSLTWVAIVLPTTFGEVIALKLRKPQGEGKPYLYTQVFSGIAYIVASVFLGLLWKVKRRERMNDN